MPGMREDFENAIAQLDGEELPHKDEEVVEDAVAETPAPEAQAEERTEGEQPEVEATGQAETAPEGQEQTQKEESDPAPVSWTPAAREEWQNLPPSVKQMVAKRESEIMQALEDGKENRKVGEYIGHLEQQYGELLQAEGASSMVEAVDHMAKTVAAMRYGEPWQKAQIIANFINSYGIDVEMLDGILSHSPAAQAARNPQAQPQIPPELQERMAMYDQAVARLQQQDAMAAQQLQLNADREVASFAEGREFFNDVRDEMADLIEFYAQKGQNLSLEAAYDKVCAMHPEIQQVIRSRQTRDKRTAASSVHGRPASQGANPEPQTIRDALNAAFSGE